MFCFFFLTCSIIYNLWIISKKIKACILPAFSMRVKIFALLKELGQNQLSFLPLLEFGYWIMLCGLIFILIDWMIDWFFLHRPHYVPQAGPTPAVVPPQASAWWDRTMHHQAVSTLSFPDSSHYSSSDSTWQPAEWPQHRLCSLLSSSASERTHTSVSFLMLHMPLCSTATPEISNLGGCFGYQLLSMRLSTPHCFSTVHPQQTFLFSCFPVLVSASLPT